jgi:hypothetical protein
MPNIRLTKPDTDLLLQWLVRIYSNSHQVMHCLDCSAFSGKLTSRVDSILYIMTKRKHCLIQIEIKTYWSVKRGPFNKRTH